jgi:hypothetical protein
MSEKRIPFLVLKVLSSVEDSVKNGLYKSILINLIR